MSGLLGRLLGIIVLALPNKSQIPSHFQNDIMDDAHTSE